MSLCNKVCKACFQFGKMYTCGVSGRTFKRVIYDMTDVTVVNLICIFKHLDVYQMMEMMKKSMVFMLMYWCTIILE